MTVNDTYNYSGYSKFQKNYINNKCNTADNDGYRYSNFKIFLLQTSGVTKGSDERDISPLPLGPIFLL